MVLGTGRRAALAVVGVGLALVMAACGSDNKSTTSASQSSTTAGAAVTTTPTTVAATTTTVPAVVKTAGVDPYGTVLTDSSGKALYTRDSDPAGSSSCTGSCAGIWPPLVLAAGQTSAGAAPAGVTGALTTAPRPDGNGTQVFLGGKALYTYAQDTGPGVVKGDGVGGIWHVAKAA